VTKAGSERVSAVKLDCCGRGGTQLVGVTLNLLSSSLLAVLESICRLVLRLVKIRIVALSWCVRAASRIYIAVLCILTAAVAWVNCYK